MAQAECSDGPVTPFKVGSFRGADQVALVHPAVFVREATATFERLCIAVPASAA